MIKTPSHAKSLLKGKHLKCIYIQREKKRKGRGEREGVSRILHTTRAMEETSKCKVVRPPRHRISVVPLLFIFAFVYLLPSSQPLNLTGYREALHQSLLYFEAQRSGHLPYNQRVTWRHHSGLTDGLEQGVRSLL